MINIKKISMRKIFCTTLLIFSAIQFCTAQTSSTGNKQKLQYRGL